VKLSNEFTVDGLLPEGDFAATFEELRNSILVQGPINRSLYWDAAWRLQLIENLEVLVNQLWTVGVSEIFVDGSFVEEKDHPNDIDGYFVCDEAKLITKELHQSLNAFEPFKIWT
jgi:hypothetical protein